MGTGPDIGGFVNHDADMRIGKVELTRQAADWFVRISSDTLSEQELAQWLKWVSVEDNAIEFQHIRAISLGVESLRSELPVPRDGWFAAERFQTVDRLKSPAPSPADAIMRVSWRAKVSIAATLVGAALAVGYVTHLGWPSGPSGVEVPRTAIHSALLPDGSNMIVAPGTNLAFDFSGLTRDLVLSRGEAFFKVQPDKARPFVVRAGGISATAVGTAFDVSAEADRVMVTVQEGTVAVANHSATKGGHWRLTAGFRAVFDATTNSVTVSTVDAASALAWREGRLDYYNEPLRVVAADVSRYSSRTIEIGDPNIGNLTFTGTVFTAEVDDWLEAIRATFPVRVSRHGADYIVLSGPDGEPPAKFSH